MKREYKCKECDVIITGKLKLVEGEMVIVADDGPPDPDQTTPEEGIMCIACADPYEGSFRAAADNEGARIAAESRESGKED